MRALRSILFAAALAVPACAAHAAVGVYIGVGQPVYREYVPACPGPGYAWNAGYYSYGRWFPGRWIAAERFRGHEFREHEAWEHRDRDEWRDRNELRERGFRDHDAYRDHDREHEGWRR
jgi:hypothetical protein